MGTMASQITSLMIVYLTVYSGTDQRKHQSCASLAFVRGIHRGLVNSPHKGPVKWKTYPFDDVIMHQPTDQCRDAFEPCMTKVTNSRQPTKRHRVAIEHCHEQTDRLTPTQYPLPWPFWELRWLNSQSPASTRQCSNVVKPCMSKTDRLTTAQAHQDQGTKAWIE